MIILFYYNMIKRYFMYSDIEKQILLNSGWNEKEIDYFGVKIYKITNKEGKQISHVLSKSTENEIIIEFSVPDKNGEKINVVFDRKNQNINFEKTDQDIKTNEDLFGLLNIISITIQSNKGIFLPSKKIEAEKNNNFKNL